MNMINPGPRLSERFHEGLVRFRWHLLVTAVIVTAVAWWPARQLSFSYDLEAMFAPDDPQLVAYRKAKEVFGGQELCVIAYEDPELVTPGGLARLNGLADRLRRIKAVDKVQHLADVKRDGQRTILDELTARPELADEIRTELVGTELFGGTLIGRDGRTTSILVYLDLGADRQAGLARLVGRIRDVMDASQLTYHLGGAPGDGRQRLGDGALIGVLLHETSGLHRQAIVHGLRVGRSEPS